jgi:uncharacterized membrane protein
LPRQHGAEAEACPNNAQSPRGKLQLRPQYASLTGGSKPLWEERLHMLLFLAFLIGIIAGLRALTAPAVVAWGAALGWFDLSQSPLAFMAYRWTPWIFTLLALVELVTDQLPSTPSRKVPMQFGARLIMGGLSGAAIGASSASLIGGLVAGIVGAIIGTLGGAAARGKLASTFGKDPPAAIIEDAVAIIGAVLIVAAV